MIEHKALERLVYFYVAWQKCWPVLMGRKTCRKRVLKSDLEPPTDDIVYSLDDSFNRIYDYNFDSSWQLPSPTKFFREDSLAWQDEELISMKSYLNDVKGRLSSIDIVTWQSHTQVCCCYAWQLAVKQVQWKAVYVTTGPP